MDPVTNLLDYLRVEPSEAEWATAKSKRDRFQDSRNTTYSTTKNDVKPQALLEKYCAEGKIARNHLDERCLSYMRNLSADIQCQALSEYANRRSKDNLKNPPAYFMSLLQSLETAAHKTDALKKKLGLREGILSALVPEAQALLQHLQADGSIGEYELDSSCITWLGKLSASQQTQVLQQYANVRHRDKLRCNAAFFMGLLRQVADGKAGKAQSSELNSPQQLSATPSSISPEARQKLNELYAQGDLDSALMHGPCIGLLAVLPKSAQLGAVVTLAMEIGSAANKQAYIVQTLKGMIAASNAASGLHKGHQFMKPGSASAVSKLVSNTGKVINPNEVSIRLNPSSAFYDADLAMCWRVLTKQDKAEWQARIASGQRPKLKSLSLPRQKLAKQLHPSHSQYHHATAAAWKHTDAADKEFLLQSADTTGEDISTMHSQPTHSPDPNFLDMDFPPLGGSPESQPKQASEEDNEQNTAAAQAAVISDPLRQTDTGTDGQTSRDLQGLESGTMPLHNMGMAFQHSFSLQDMMQADPSIATSSPTSALHQGLDPAKHSTSAGQAGGTLPAKPSPPGRQTEQPLDPQRPLESVDSLPYASGPFPGVHKPSVGSAFGQTAQKTEPAAAAPAFDVGILAQHAFGRAHAEPTPMAGPKRPQYLSPDTRPTYAVLRNNADLPMASSLSRTASQDSNAVHSNRREAYSFHSADENQVRGFDPVIAQYVTPTPPVPPQPLSESTTAVNTSTQGAYVSFDEWQAQVRAKQLAQQRVGMFY